MSPQFYHALLLATNAHHGQVRSGIPEPYILHPIRVANMALTCGLPEHVQIAGLLHDVVEDTPVLIDELRVDPMISERVVQMVQLLTHWWPPHAREDVKESGRLAYYAAMRDDYETEALKLLDRADNCDSFARAMQLPTVKPSLIKWATKYAARTHRDLLPIAKRLYTHHQQPMRTAAMMFGAYLAHLDATIKEI